MSTFNIPTPEVAIIESDLTTAKGYRLCWLFSKTQLEYILHDIASLPSESANNQQQRAQYQEEVLPVISLENHFGLPESGGMVAPRYMVLKIAVTDGQKTTRVIIHTCNQVRIRKLDFAATQVEPSELDRNCQDVLGTFSLPDNRLAVIPDLAAITESLSMIGN